MEKPISNRTFFNDFMTLKKVAHTSDKIWRFSLKPHGN